MTAPKPETPAEGRPAADEREKRSLVSGPKLEIRSGDGGNGENKTEGYAAVFNSDTSIGGYWIERFAPGAFSKSLRENDVVALNSHETARVVGRTSSGTLTLREDDKGLAFENTLPDTTDGRDLAVLIKRGDVAGMSFAFRATKEQWDETTDPPTRTILEARIYEITYTAFPAYPSTEVGLRSLEHARAESRQHNRDGALSRLAAKRARLSRAERGI